MLRAIFYCTDGLKYVYFKPRGNWLSFRNNAYYIDKKAICQVVGDNGRLKGVNEILFFEHNPVPLRSELNVRDLTEEHLNLKEAEVYTHPATSFLESIKRFFGRN
jgi:hypothetical protein